MTLRALLKAPPARLGRRGSCLTLLGIIWVCVGVSTALTPSPEGYVLLSGYEHLRGALWVATGVVAMVYAWKPQGHDWPGFVSLYLMAGYRFAAYMFGFAQWFGSHHEGNPRGGIAAFTWVIIIVLIVTVAGWRESADDDHRAQDDLT